MSRKWTSSSFAAYPADLNLYLARVLASLVVPIHELESQPASEPAAQEPSPPPQASAHDDDDDDYAPIRPDDLPDSLPDRSPAATVDTSPPSPAPLSPSKQRFPNRLGGERGVIGDRIHTRS